jgi:hypothetical protein
LQHPAGFTIAAMNEVVPLIIIDQDSLDYDVFTLTILSALMSVCLCIRPV